jgi:hypothetical protein
MNVRYSMNEPERKREAKKESRENILFNDICGDI